MTTRGVDVERPMCPACGQHPVPAGDMTCRYCWGHIPHANRLAVRLAHRTWIGDPTDQNWAAYMRARRDALEAINEHP